MISPGYLPLAAVHRAQHVATWGWRVISLDFSSTLVWPSAKPWDDHVGLLAGTAVLPPLRLGDLGGLGDAPLPLSNSRKGTTPLYRSDIHPRISAADGGTKGNGDDIQVCAAWYDQSSGRPTPRSIRRWVRLLPEPSLPLPSFVMMITILNKFKKDNKTRLPWLLGTFPLFFRSFGV